jgi:hypothetical protein
MGSCATAEAGKKMHIQRIAFRSIIQSSLVANIRI